MTEEHPPEPGPSDEERRLEDVIAEYLRSLERGQPLNCGELIVRYPQFEAQLESFFANRDAMNQDRDSGTAPTERRRIRYIGEYELLEPIGQGGMGVVYRARQKGLNRLVAVKLIKAGEFASEEDVRRFLAEARAAAQLDHPGIVSIHEVGEDDGQHYFSMDFVRGRDLREITHTEPLAAGRAVGYLLQAAGAVRYAHTRGLLHRDIKPSNLLVGEEDDRVRVTDFGLAKWVDDGGSNSSRIAGTPSYMSPEQALGQKNRIGITSDVYALGATLYALLTGVPPFRGETPVSTMKAVCELEPALPRRLSPDIPRDLETICLKCLEKTPANRYPTVDALIDDLQRFQDGKPIQARPVSSVEKAVRWCRRNPVTATLVGSLAAAVIAIALAGVGMIRDAAVRQALRVEARFREYLASTVQADEASRNQEIQRAETMLSKCPEDLRGFEWFYSYAVLHGQLRTVLDETAPPKDALYADPQHARQVTCADFHPAMAWVVTASGDLYYKDHDRLPSPTNLLLWDAASGELLRQFEGHANVVQSLAFSPDGSRLASIDESGVSNIWNVDTGELLQSYSDQPGAGEGIRLSADGKIIFTTHILPTDDPAYQVAVREVDTGAVRRTWRESGEHPAKADLHPTRTLVAVAGWHHVENQSVVSLRDYETGNLVASRPGPPGSTVRHLRFDHNGELLYCVSDDALEICDASSLEVLERVRLAHGNGFGFDLSPDRQRLAWGGDDLLIRVWNFADQRLETTLAGHEEQVRSLAFSPDGSQLASGSIDGTARLWDLTRPISGCRLNTYESARLSLALGDFVFRRQGGQIVVARPQFDGRSRTAPALLRIIDTTTGQILFEHCIDASCRRASPRNDYCFSPSGRWLVAPRESDRQAVGRWDVDTGELANNLAFHRGEIRAVTCDPKERYVAATATIEVQTEEGSQVPPNSTVQVWQTSDGRPVLTVTRSGVFIHCLAFSHNGRWLAWAEGPGRSARDTTVCLYDLRRSEVVDAFHLASRCLALAFHPSDEQLAVAAFDRSQVFVWNVVDGDWLYKPLDAPAAVADLAYTPDGCRLAATGFDGDVQLWNAQSGDPLKRFQDLGRRVGAAASFPGVAFDQDGRRMASYNTHGSINLWDARAGEAERRAEADTRRNLWHLAQAFRAAEHNHDFSVSFHLKRVLNAENLDVHHLVLAGDVYALARRWPEARDCYQRAVQSAESAGRATPTSPFVHYALLESHNRLAWFLATCPEADLRDPARAIELAESCIGATSTIIPPHYLATLAAAHAAGGRFDEAVPVQERVVGMTCGQHHLTHQSLLDAYTGGEMAPFARIFLLRAQDRP